MRWNRIIATRTTFVRTHHLEEQTSIALLVRGRLTFNCIITRQHQSPSHHVSPHSQSNKHEHQPYEGQQHHLQRAASARGSNARCGRGICSVFNIGRGTYRRGTSRQQQRRRIRRLRFSELVDLYSILRAMYTYVGGDQREARPLVLYATSDGVHTWWECIGCLVVVMGATRTALDVVLQETLPAARRRR